MYVVIILYIGCYSIVSTVMINYGTAVIRTQSPAECVLEYNLNVQYTVHRTSTVSLSILDSSLKFNRELNFGDSTSAHNEQKRNNLIEQTCKYIILYKYIVKNIFMHCTSIQ